MIYKNDILIIGSGIAGLSCALKLADKFKVLIITKETLTETNTRYAQGGIASVTSGTDDFESHIKDTLKAGAGLCNEETVSQIVHDGPRLIEDLIEWGVKFSKRDENEEFDLTKEGGHSKRRILHAGDITGNELQRALSEQIKAHPNITVKEHHIAIDLILAHKIDPRYERQCLGAFILDSKTNDIHSVSAKATVLATGGGSKVYLYTSNPDVACGDGVAMAYRAGADVANLEFVQFHPTSLYNPGAWAPTQSKHVQSGKNFLLSEALRGEGAHLKTLKGMRFMKKYDKRGELASRDIVARAIDKEMKESGDDCVLLDISHKDKDFITQRFPNIHQVCLENGFDMTLGPLPVVPAAHYFCGGVKTSLQGQTSVPRLYAIGEVACTGLHGANRLASNSLLEAVAMADYTSNSLHEKLPDIPNLEIPIWNSGTATDIDEAVVISQNWDELRRVMWNFVGIVRSNKRLIRAKRRIDLLQEEIKEFYWDFTLTRDLIELRNLACVASLVVNCALLRKESRGLHFNLDYPDLKTDKGCETVVSKKTLD